MTVLPPRQLTLDLPHVPSRSREDFVESDANRLALQMVEAWPAWQARGLVLAGPAGSGKSHLAEIWRERSGASVVWPADMSIEYLAAFNPPAGIVLEDVDRAMPDERALFHLLNLRIEHGFDLLLTARRPPAAWEVGLPDLRSRLAELPLAQLQPPDDMLLFAVMMKQFSDRQLAIEPDLVAFLTSRMERSLAAAGRLVEALDRVSLAEGRRITKPLASRVLAAMDEV